VTAAEAPLEVLTDAGDLTAVDDFGTGLPGEIVPVSAADFDPQGGDRAEMPELVPSAIDERSDTAWTTDTYFAADLDGKAGTGLMLDLGESLPVSAVRLELLGSGSSVKVLIGAEPFKKISKWTQLASAEGIGTTSRRRPLRPGVVHPVAAGRRRVSGRNPRRHRPQVIKP
jgi:hypothetical protein